MMTGQSFILMFSAVLVVITLNAKTHVDGSKSTVWRSNAGEDPNCKDHNRHCAGFKRHKKCEDPKFDSWMKEKCARTCGFCVPRPPLCKSSKYGCCQDRVTPADGPRRKGCAVKLCVDTIVCDNLKNACDSKSRLLKEWITERCASTCGLCRAPASPKQRCEVNKPLYGCCWNGDEATGPGNKGCAACVDTSRHVCNLLKDKCQTRFYTARSFMEQHCPQTCGRCPQDCHDVKKKCGRWALEGLCKQMFWNHFMKKHCPRSCGHCTAMLGK